MDTKANLMTYNTFTFKTEAQMLLFRRIWEDNGTALFDKLKKKGCTRFCLNQIWNMKGTFKISILFEYESPNSFKQCQNELENFISLLSLSASISAFLIFSPEESILKIKLSINNQIDYN